ncbi:P protein-like [Oopsacas minuta]|uniref:P protein-like n=1 Tax=Oopsacas minuta TaxID=111878 RepID=A0AAV7K6R8_9METZ|nr:P protein-like [Oopsacas minuta]
MNDSQFKRKKEVYLSFQRPAIGDTTISMDNKHMETSFSGEEEFLLPEAKPHSKKRLFKIPIIRMPNSKEDYHKIFRFTLATFLFLLIFCCAILLVYFPELESESYIIAVQGKEDYVTQIHDINSHGNYFVAELNGPFLSDECNYTRTRTGAQIYNQPNALYMNVLQHGRDGYNVTTFCVRLDTSHNGSFTVEDSTNRHVQKFQQQVNDTAEVAFYSTSKYTVAFGAKLSVVFSPNLEILYAALVLLFVYSMIIFEFVHRTVAAMLGSTLAIAILAILDKRPELEEIISWIDYETVCLLFGMMIIVGIIADTGFFDYFAIKAYRLSRGKVWPLIFILCMFAGVVSAFLDNVTTILLLTPVTIRLCQVLNIDPRPILLAEVMFSNIGGTATAIGDPPNVIIVSNKAIKREGIDFVNFTVHMAIGIFFCMVAAFFFLRLLYCRKVFKNNDSPHVAELKREKAIWLRQAKRIGDVTLEEKQVKDALLQKAKEVQARIKEEALGASTANKWKDNLRELEDKYRITNKVLLFKCCIVLFFVLSMFFMSASASVHLDLGWASLLGAILLIVWADIHDFEHLLEKVEWGTLLFFAALFVLMKALEEMGLIEFIGIKTKDLIEMVDSSNRLAVAVILILWVSALASSFIDNIPFTTAMTGVILKMAETSNDGESLPIKPLIWALAFGACLGGNGTLIGASANVVCVGIAEQNGYKITFFQFFRVGFPMMLFTTFIAMIYLVICHALIEWNYY